MANQLVSAGGVKGVQELGVGTNQALTDNIFRLVDSTISQNIAKTKSKQAIEGAARVAQGESLGTIQASQGVFDNIFGAATIAGAEAQTLIQAKNKHALDLQTNMDSYKHLTTEEFIDQQQAYVTENLITGNPNVDPLIVAASSEAIAAGTAQHAKAHAMFVQQKNKLAFEETVFTASKTFDSLLNDPEIATEDKLTGLYSLQSSSSRMPGQTEQAWKNSLAENILSDLKAGRPSLYNGFIQGSIVIDGEEIDTTDPSTGKAMIFDPETRTKLDEAFARYKGIATVDQKIASAKQMNALVVASKNPTIGAAEFTEMLENDFRTPGSTLTTAKFVELQTAKGRTNLEATDVNTRMRSIADRSVAGTTDTTGLANDLGLYEAKLLEQAKTPEDLERVMSEVTQASIDVNVVPSTWTAQWDASMANPVMQDGKANLQYIKGFQHFITRYKENPRLFGNSKAVDPLVLSTALGVDQMMQVYDMPVDQAVVEYSHNRKNSEEARAYVSSVEGKQKIARFAEDPDQMSFGLWDSWFGKFNNMKDQFSIKQGLSTIIQRKMLETGDTGDGVFPAAVLEWQNTHEAIQGYPVYSGKTTLANQAGISDNSVSFDDAMTYYMQTKGTEKFGAGFDPDTATLSFTPGLVHITPRDEEGIPIALGNVPAGTLTSIPIEAIGAVYNTEVTNIAINDAYFKRQASIAFDASEFADDPLGTSDGSMQGIMENRQSVEFAQGGAITGDLQDINTYKALQDPIKGKQINSLLQGIAVQFQNGNFTGVKKSIDAIARITAEPSVSVKETMFEEEGAFHPRAYNPETKLHTAYKDSKDVLTIGAGHTKDVKEGDVLTTEEVEAVFKEDWKIATERASELPNFDKLDAPLQEALTKISFQAGSLTVWPKLMKALEANDRISIIEELKNSQWFKKDSPARAKRTLVNL